MLAEMEARVANPRVRAVGTLGGNLSFAEPHSDPPTALLAYDATVTLHGTAGARTLPPVEFIRGSYETALEPDEILAGVTVPEPAPPPPDRRRGARGRRLRGAGPSAARHGGGGAGGRAAHRPRPRGLRH